MLARSVKGQDFCAAGCRYIKTTKLLQSAWKYSNVNLAITVGHRFQFSLKIGVCASLHTGFTEATFICVFAQINLRNVLGFLSTQRTGKGLHAVNGHSEGMNYSLHTPATLLRKGRCHASSSRANLGQIPHPLPSHPVSTASARPADTASKHVPKSSFAQRCPPRPRWLVPLDTTAILSGLVSLFPLSPLF